MNPAKDLKFLVVGAGSIGSRHLRNLRGLGVRDIEVCETSPKTRGHLKRWFKGAIHGRLSDALRSKPGVAVVATPTHLHLPVAAACARAGCHLFIEKPLSHSMRGLRDLGRLIRRRKLVCLVGCNLRFHPGLRLLKESLAKGMIGRVWSARIEFGYYLPFWRPGRDYRKTYSARAREGGGVLLDCIHEIDYARWLFGPLAPCAATAPRKSVLRLNVEESVDLILGSRSGFLVDMHLDYLQKAYRRNCVILGEAGALEWDWNRNGIRWYWAKKRKWRPIGRGRQFELNDMYVGEMKHFLRCLGCKERPEQGFQDAVEALEIVLALKKRIRKL